MAIKRIAALLGVSSSTVSIWVRDVPLTDEQQRALRDAHQGTDAVAHRTGRWSRLCRSRRELAQAEGRAAARAGDSLHLTGCMLYWAEGAKDRNQLSFANSDPAMVHTFCAFLRDALHLPDERLTIRVNAYTSNGLDARAIEAYWLSVCALPQTQLRKSTFDYRPASSRALRERKLPYGVCTVKVTRSTAIVQHIYGAIQEYAGFDEPRWLG